MDQSSVQSDGRLFYFRQDRHFAKATELVMIVAMSFIFWLGVIYLTTGVIAQDWIVILEGLF